MLEVTVLITPTFQEEVDAVDDVFHPYIVYPVLEILGEVILHPVA